MSLTDVRDVIDTQFMLEKRVDELRVDDTSAHVCAYCRKPTDGCRFHAVIVTRREIMNNACNDCVKGRVAASLASS